MLQLSARRLGDTVVLHCTGRMVAGQGLKTLQRTATKQRATALIFDLRDVEALDAAGLGTLLRVRQWCEAQGMNLKLINPNKHVRELMALTALDSILDVRSAVGSDDVQTLLPDACAETCS